MNINSNSSATVAPNQATSKNENHSHTSSLTLKPDLAQAKRFLEALGFKSDGKLPIRTFAGKPQNKFPEAKTHNLANLPPKQSPDCGVYIAINGNYGAHKKEDITQARAIFCEHDDLSIEEQLYLWQEKGLPEPTIQVQTRHSVHTYWVFSEPISKEQFEELHPDLISFMASDKACKDISRVMRVAGYYHVEYGLEPELCEIISDSGKAYTFDEMRERIPKQQPELKPETKEPKKPKKEPKKTTKSRVDGFSTDSFLEAVCSKLDAEDIYHWEGHQFQFDASANKYRGYCPFHDSKSGTAFYIDEVNGIYKWRCPACDIGGTPLEYLHQINGYSGSPTGDDFKAIVEWLADKSGIEKPDMSKATGKGVKSKKGVASKEEQKDLITSIDNIIELNLSDAQVQEKIGYLSLESGFQTYYLKDLYQKRLNEIEKATTSQETAQELSKLEELDNVSLPLDKILDKRLAKPLQEVVKVLGSRDEAMLTTLLPVAASLIPIGTKLEIIKKSNFYSLPIVYTGVIGDSGSNKSATQKTLINPLIALQNNYEEQYEENLKIWEADCAEANENGEDPPQKPEQIDLFTQDATSEAVAKIQAKQPNDGLFVWKDELSALIKDNDAYRGKGSDAEKLLSGRDGTPLKVDRASGKRLYIKQSGYSLTGTIQPDNLKKQIDFNDATGHWARFLFCHIPESRNPFPEDDCELNLTEMLKSLYQNLKKLEPTVYRLSKDAKELYRQWYNFLDDTGYQETRQGLKNVYSKMKGDTGVVALILHCIDGAFNGCLPEKEVSAETMRKAIELIKFYIAQIKNLHSEGDVEDGVLSAIYKKLLTKASGKGFVSASNIKQADRTFKKMEASEIRKMFQELADMGRGEVSGSGSRLKFKTLDKIDKNRQKIDTLSIPSNADSEGDIGSNNNKNRQIDTFTTSTTTQSSPNGGKEVDKKIDTDTKEDVYLSNVSEKTPESPSQTETEKIDSVSRVCLGIDKVSIFEAKQPLLFQAEDVETAKRYDNPYLQVWHLIENYPEVALSAVANALDMSPKEAKKHLDAIVDAGHREVTDSGLYWDAF